MWNMTRFIRMVLFSILAVMLATGCWTSKTRISIPPQIFDETLSADVRPATYWSDKNILVDYERLPDGTTRLRLSGDSASVIEAKGYGYARATEAYGGAISDVTAAVTKGATEGIIGYFAGRTQLATVVEPEITERRQIKADERVRLKELEPVKEETPPEGGAPPPVE